MRFHFLFEQSGTFRDVFKKHGHKAWDYDIANDYGKTDYKIDLFCEIERKYNMLIGTAEIHPTIFEDMTSKNDFIFAFFPCTHFCDFNSLTYRLWCGGRRLPLDLKNIKKLIARNQERSVFFGLYLKFCFICKTLGIPTIIENPASGGASNYLELFSPIDVGYKERNRALFGDNFKKPTNFFAINFTMKENFIMFYDMRINTKIISHQRGKGKGQVECNTRERSEITPEYAENFYKRFIQKAVEHE